MNAGKFNPDALIDAMAPLLELEIAPEYRPAIRQHLEVAAKMATLVDAFELEDDAEPAPVYRP